MTKDQCGDVHVVFFVLDDWNTPAIVPNLDFVVYTEIIYVPLLFKISFLKF